MRRRKRRVTTAEFVAFMAAVVKLTPDQKAELLVVARRLKAEQDARP